MGSPWLNDTRTEIRAGRSPVDIPLLRVALEGPATAHGGISAEYFSDCLDGLYHLISLVSIAVTGVPIPPEVRGDFERGTFVFHLGPPKDTTEVAIWIAGIDALLRLLGVPIGETGGLRALLTWVGDHLKDREPLPVPPSPTGDLQDTIEFLARDTHTIRALKNATRPLRSALVEEMRFSRTDGGMAILTRKDAREIAQLLKRLPPVQPHSLHGALPIPVQPQDPRSTEEAVELEIVQPSLDGTEEWVFDVGSHRIKATVLDTEFLDRVRSRQIVFGRGDRLVARMRTLHWMGNKPGGTHQILEVQKVIQL